MTSKREQVLQAVKALLTAALPDGEVSRNADKPDRIAPGGALNMHDGDMGEPTDIFLSPYTETYDHRIPVDVGCYDSDKPREEVLDEILTDIGARILADRTLGGLCEWVEGELAPPDDIGAEGAESFRWAELTIVCTYTTTDPLH